MFGLFKKKKPKKKPKATTSAKPRKKAQPKKAKDVQKITNNELLATVNTLQKELDKLKLVVTGGVTHDVKENGKITAQAMADLQRNPVSVETSGSERIVEGVFDGQHMIGADGLQYDVPPNYASKSMLVEGDILKLTISNLGSFIYKQIKPIDRVRKVGVLEQDEQDMQYYAVAEGKKWQLLTASVTYYKGEPGDEVFFLIPTDAGSRWAAVENIIQQ